MTGIASWLAAGWRPPVHPQSAVHPFRRAGEAPKRYPLATTLRGIGHPGLDPPNATAGGATMSDLLVIKFDGANTADEALASVRSVERGGGFGLTDTAVVSKSQDGAVRVKNEWSSGAETGAVVGGVLGAMVSFMFPPAGAAIGAGLGALVGSKFDTGVDQGFVKDVSEALKPDTSALFLMLKSGGDAAAVVSAFRPFKGTVYQTTLSPDFESSLQRALSGAA
jgi:uncharacterized membrane protein